MENLKKHYINGQWVEAVTQTLFDVINPADETIAGTISLGSEQDMETAIKAANAAFSTFRCFNTNERINLLQKLLSVYEERFEEMAQAISIEMGAPLDLARKEQAASGLENLKMTISVLENFQFDRISHEGKDKLLYEPIGVAGLITPWNWPMNQISLKVAPALGVGCTVVLKPSELAPLSAHLFAEFIDEAGFPAGVFNLVNGDGPTIGTYLSSHPLVDMVSFTGSTRGGISVAKNAADTVKRVSQELGGKSPNIIFSSANIEKAVTRGVRHCFHNTGQSCNAPTRMLVERSVYNDAVEIAGKVAEKTDVGLPSNEGRHIGPLVSQTQWQKVQSLIQKAIHEGNNLVAGGAGKPEGFDNGYYVRPTIFSDVKNENSIAREEVFGPVLAMIPFDTEKEAIEIANDTPYGLAAYINTENMEQGERVARALRSGNVHINGSSLSLTSPFGGYKQSGNGREWGIEGFEEFLETKAIMGAA